MLLKEININCIFLIGITKGIVDGFCNFPKNILNTENVDYESRQRFDGWLKVINKILEIIILICNFIDFYSLY